ncbi:MAG: TIGR00730 family Rossman fold protein [Leptolyngbya sp. SIO3F4]|nr:TIGR00730 family Rossman fold protein [Leptolyngbya sp. SIO3F4]
MKKICVFCGSSPGVNVKYKEAAFEFGKLLAAENYELVYGGGSTGIMGFVADACLEAGGEVTGVIPDFLIAKEVGHKGLTQQIEVKSMHERKQKMADISDAFVALPGGMGTMDELCEIVTWSQLGLHNKPVGILNTQTYFTPFIQFMDHMVSQRFLSEENRQIIVEDESPKGLIDKLINYTSPKTEKWLDRDKT